MLVFAVGVLSNFLIDSRIFPISGVNNAFFPNCRKNRHYFSQLNWYWYRSQKGEKNHCIVTVTIAHIINLSLITGVVPDDLKSARVVPLFKKSDKTETGNYRPVSILNIVSKVLERVIYDQFEGVLLQNK